MITSKYSLQKIATTHPDLPAVIATSIGLPTDEKTQQVLDAYRAENHSLMGCFVEGNLIGVIGVEQSETQVKIEHLSVVAKFQSRGVGKMLVESLMAIAKVIFAETDDESVGFYRALGFDCQPFYGPYGKRYKCMLLNKSENKKLVKIKYEPLQTYHLPLLLKWLEAPHVKAWWDHDLHWTMDLVIEKYESYVDGYKLEDGIKKPIRAYIACVHDRPVGYIQLYNAHDYPREDGASLDHLPKSLAAIDIFIGEEAYLGKGYGSAIMKQFMEEYVDPKYDACFVDPDLDNIQAIKAYENAGFKSITTTEKSVWMWRKKA
jgi:GNAT superfamily N-acetyltransferase